MIRQLNSWNYGADELFFQTLTASDDLKAPNAFTHKCLDKKVDVPYITRFSAWIYSSTPKCFSGKYNHGICVIGIEDLAKNLRDKNNFLFANKIQADLDFGAILCWHEEMRSRTLVDKGLKRLNSTSYQNWPQAIFKLINYFIL
uniref:Uncharacterized protein n=1 Tax=Meloidogyne enterolobii TaxID=390850 RepID=A0A6V7ULR7_MELEN|nr:unnamed protein product [Meloidogyne enterolobii]